MTNKQKYMNTHTHAWTTMNIPWTPMTTWARMSTHEFTWIRVFSKYNAAGKLLVEPYVSQFLNFLFWVVGYVSFWFNCFFLNWTLILFLCFIFFLVLSCGGFAPRKKIADFCKPCFFIYLYIVIYFFFIYLFTFIYIYLCIYICVYIYMCVCVMFCIYIYNYVYIYVCVGGRLSQNEVSFFSLKEPF